MPTRAQSYGRGLSPLELLLLLTSIWQLKKLLIWILSHQKGKSHTAHLLQNNFLHLIHQHSPEGPSMTTPWWLLHPLPLLWHDTHLALVLITSSYISFFLSMFQPPFSFSKNKRCRSLCQAGSPHTFFPEQNLIHSLGLSSSAESFLAEIR